MFNSQGILWKSCGIHCIKTSPVSVFWRFSTVALWFYTLLLNRVVALPYFCCFTHLCHCCRFIACLCGVIKVCAPSSWRVSNLEKMFKKEGWAGGSWNTSLANTWEKAFQIANLSQSPMSFSLWAQEIEIALFNTCYLPLSFLWLSFRFSQVVFWPGSFCSDWEAHHSWRVSEATLPPQKFYVVCFNESGTGKYCFWTHDGDFVYSWLHI